MTRINNPKGIEHVYTLVLNNNPSLKKKSSKNKCNRSIIKLNILRAVNFIL